MEEIVHDVETGTYWQGHENETSPFQRKPTPEDAACHQDLLTEAVVADKAAADDLARWWRTASVGYHLLLTMDEQEWMWIEAELGMACLKEMLKPQGEHNVPTGSYRKACNRVVFQVTKKWN